MPYQRYSAQEQTAPMAQMPQPQATSVALNYIKGRPVVSIDEARASQIDLDGSLYVFPDLGNKRIYTKQINMDGTASFNIFELKEDCANPVETAPTQPYVTHDELNTILEQFKESLNAGAAKPKPIINL